ncbi:unnamed protein product [Mucor hiemalis]
MTGLNPRTIRGIINDFSQLLQEDLRGDDLKIGGPVNQVQQLWGNEADVTRFEAAAPITSENHVNENLTAS